MASSEPIVERIPCFCALCTSRCGSIAVVEDGRFVALEPDPSHPTGKALCAKGRAAPEITVHPERLRYPLRRTRPKGDPDPGWERIGWDEALDATAAALRRIADEEGPGSIAISSASPSTSAIGDSFLWIERLMHAVGSVNWITSMELCGWGRYFAPLYTWGAAVPGDYMPDLDGAGCILYWGYNPSLARLVHATATVAAKKRGARLIVVDPRRAGMANKADLWLQVRPGTDAALALGIAHVMIVRDWYDRDFVRDWSNAPLLVRDDDGRLLTGKDLGADESRGYVAWDERRAAPILYDPASGQYEGDGVEPALFGTYTIETVDGTVVCRPVFELVARGCAAYPPERVEEICGVDAGRVVAAARMLWESRPVAYYAWSGVEMQTGATQIARAIGQLYALTGSFDGPGGNVLFPAIPTPDLSGRELVTREQVTGALGYRDRPLGPARWLFTTTDEFYTGVLRQEPYPMRGLINFGSNLLLSHADGLRGREALAALDFYVHADLFMNPTAELADIVLPVASPFEYEALKIGFEVSTAAQSRVQLRRRIVAPPGEARSDTEIIFDLATRLGLGEHFWDGDIQAAYRHQLEPSGLSLERLREQPAGIDVPLESRYRRYAERGFDTPSKKIELYSETLLEGGYPPLPTYEEPLVGPRARPDLAARYPLVLTCAKHTLFCETQHRGLPSLRRRALDPEVELHPDAATARGIAAGDWVAIETPDGSVRARARLNDSLQPDVVCGQHGWWQAAPEIDAPGYDPFSSEGANFNLIIGNQAIDPISGSVPHRAYLCEVRRVE